MVELNLYVLVCCGSMSRHLGYAHCIDLHVLLVSVYIFLLCNKKLSYLPHSLDNTTKVAVFFAGGLGTWKQPLSSCFWVASSIMHAHRQAVS